MSDRAHAMTDYLIAIGLHLNDGLSFEEVIEYFKRLSPQDSGHPAVHCTSILLAGLRSGTLEPWNLFLRPRLK